MQWIRRTKGKQVGHGHIMLARHAWDPGAPVFRGDVHGGATSRPTTRPRANVAAIAAASHSNDASHVIRSHTLSTMACRNVGDLPQLTVPM
jgi:hypothetical protein